ncbi:MAG: hypothetical protein H6834_12590 [Planctomycetes bacterium]|nr:hypothetical protein [Planctomycetota bacterium]
MQNDPESHEPRETRDEQRERLLRKLNCLIAVLQVAVGKVRRNLESPDADSDRLLRIRGNLENTLNICRKAKASLERRHELPDGLPLDLEKLDPRDVERQARQLPVRRPATPPPNKMNYRSYIEFSSIDEYRRFRKLPPIDREQVEDIDIEELCRRLQQQS